MDALRKLSSLGRNRSKKDRLSRSPKAESAAPESPTTPVPIVAKEEEEERESHSGLTPIRAPISDDVEEVEKDDDDAESQGSGDSFDSALERMAASSTASYEPTSPAGSLVGRSQFEGGLSEGLAPRRQEGENTVENEYNEEDREREDMDEGDDGDSSSSSSSDESSSSGNTEEEKHASEVSARAMPVAKLTTEDEEQEEDDVEEDDGLEDEVGVEEYEEAHDEGVEGPGGEENTAPVVLHGADEGTSPRIIARESKDDQYYEPESGAPSKDLAHELEKLSARGHEESVPTSNSKGSEQARDLLETDEQGPANSVAQDTTATTDVSDVLNIDETQVGRLLEETDAPSSVETGEPGEVTGTEEEPSSESKYGVARAATDDILLESEKVPEAGLQSLSRNMGEENDISKRSGEVGGKNTTSTGTEENLDSGLADSSAPKSGFGKKQSLGENAEVEDVFEDSHETQDSEDESPSELRTEGRSKSYISNVDPSSLVTAPDLAKQPVSDFDCRLNNNVSSSEEVPEVVNEGATIEGTEKEGEAPFVPKELPKEVIDEPGVVASPAKLYTALKAVDAEIPALKAEEAGEVQSNRQGFSVIFTGEDGESGEEDEDDEDDDEDDDGDTDMDTAKALAELANAVGKSGTVNETGNKPSLGAAGPSLPQRPAARKSAATSLDTAGRITQRVNGASSTELATATDENANGDGNEGNETREKLQNIRVKFLRLAHRLGQSPQNVVVAQVLYRLGLAESLRGGSSPNRTGAFSFDRANALAEEQEATNQDEELDFACTILVLGKTGVGKSATINSIFDEWKSATNAFSPSTKKVQEIMGTVHGIKVRVIDTPGLLPSVVDQQHNERIMGSVKKYIRKASPDIVLYFDRLDMQSRDYGDLPLLRTITDVFGAAVWFNAIVVLTHASSAPPDGPNGVPLSYEMFVAQRSHVIQQTIRQAAGDMRLMNPVSLVENHPACRTNRTGQRVLPNGQIWKPQLLLLCFASKILAEANSLLKLQETATPGRPFGQRSRVPPLPFLLSSLLQSRAQPKMADEQMGESDESDDEEEEDSDADDYDELPPFRPLSKEELEELSKEQRQDYYDELADRERLFQKKQYRDELRRRKEMKKRAAAMSKEELSQAGEEADDEAGKAAAVPVPMPDMALPPSFDSDNPTHRYRYLETANQWLVRPVLETHGWDHDAGYDGFNVEKMFVVKDKIPASISGQVTKDKKEAQVNFEAAASVKHGEGKVTLTGFDIQTIGKDLAYTLRAETRFNNFKRNKTTAGLTCTLLNDTIAAGLKLEDRILIGKKIKMVVNGGVLTGKGDKAYGGSLEATLRGKDYPLSRTLSTLGLSVMDWHGDLAIGGNLQSQFMVGKTLMVARANLNNRGSGQVSIRASSSEQLQMVLVGIVPILRSLINCRFGFGQPSQ